MVQRLREVKVNETEIRLSRVSSYGDTKYLVVVVAGNQSHISAYDSLRVAQLAFEAICSRRSR